MDRALSLPVIVIVKPPTAGATVNPASVAAKVLTASAPRSTASVTDSVRVDWPLARSLLSASYKDPCVSTILPDLSVDTANCSGSIRLGAAAFAGTSKVMIGLPAASATTCWVSELNQAAFQSVPLAKPNSPWPAILTQLWPLLVLSQRPPEAPEATPISALPSLENVTCAANPSLPWTGVISRQVQLVSVVSAMNTRPSAVDASRLLPLASMSTEDQSPLVTAARVLLAQARLLMRVAVPSPSFSSANCMPAALVLRSVGNTSL